MPTKIPTDVDPVNIDRVIQAVNDNYYKFVDLEGKLRYLEHRMDNFVLPASKFFFGAAIAGAVVGGYIAYVEVRRAKQDKA